MNSYLHGMDINESVGRLVLILSRGNTRTKKFKQSAIRASKITNGWAEDFLQNHAWYIIFSNEYQNIDCNIISTLNILGLKILLQLFWNYIDNIKLECIV